MDITSLSTQEKENYIRKHLQHELRLMLSSAKLWQHLVDTESGFVINIARDSVCVHFRNLLKFFTVSGTSSDISVLNFGIRETYVSDYKPWIGIIDEALLHISPKRAETKTRASTKRDLNSQIGNFRLEILELWQMFTKDTSVFRDALKESLELAERQSDQDLLVMRI